MRCICVCSLELLLRVHESRVHAHRCIWFRTYVHARIHTYVLRVHESRAHATGVYTVVLPHTGIAARFCRRPAPSLSGYHTVRIHGCWYLFFWSVNYFIVFLYKN
jgi:hypothetical protein